MGTRLSSTPAGLSKAVPEPAQTAETGGFKPASPGSVNVEWCKWRKIARFFNISISMYRISFEEFKKKLLEPGLVDHIVVISNKSVAKVYVRNSPRNQTTDSAVEVDCKYYFNIEIVDSFKKTLEEAE
ncbi:hypothetical protein OSB04_001459 [Centaurea solstitialis]|uniref:Uncharacterized protein n=1 Tax=Centaurea solstitialis TaxID=347529 RepID=A0AA38UA06_9ASTR|nr:hypothetical protein OSB04_001459 [Centaurea solstitialis]